MNPKQFCQGIYPRCCLLSGLSDQRVDRGLGVFRKYPFESGTFRSAFNCLAVPSPGCSLGLPQLCIIFSQRCPVGVPVT